MGVTKKPAVIAKTARTVKLSRSEVEMAKHFNVPLETVAKAKLKVRGRPVGSKNKPKEKPVDWEKLCKQLQGALAAQIKETDQYKRLFEQFEATSTRVNSLSFWQRVTLVFTGKI